MDVQRSDFGTTSAVIERVVARIQQAIDTGGVIVVIGPFRLDCLKEASDVEKGTGFFAEGGHKG